MFVFLEMFCKDVSPPPPWHLNSIPSWVSVVTISSDKALEMSSYCFWFSWDSLGNLTCVTLAVSITITALVILAAVDNPYYMKQKLRVHADWSACFLLSFAVQVWTAGLLASCGSVG